MSREKQVRETWSLWVRTKFLGLLCSLWRVIQKYEKVTFVVYRFGNSFYYLGTSQTSWIIRISETNVLSASHFRFIRQFFCDTQMCLESFDKICHQFFLSIQSRRKYYIPWRLKILSFLMLFTRGPFVIIEIFTRIHKSGLCKCNLSNITLLLRFKRTFYLKDITWIFRVLNLH